MTHSSPVRRGSSFRQIIHQTMSWLVMALSVICGVLGAVAAFFGAAFLINSSSVLLVIAFCVGFLITAGGAWIAARMMAWKRPGRIAFGVGIATMLVLVLISSVTIFQPLPSTPAARHSPPVPAGVRYWNLSTGSHIAYLKVPALGRARATPIFAMHTLSAPSGCKKHSGSLDSSPEGKRGQTWEANWESMAVAIRSYVCFAWRSSQFHRSHTSLGSTIGPGNAGYVMER